MKLFNRNKSCVINEYKKEDLIKIVKCYQLASRLNGKAFVDFKGVFSGKSIGLLAAGPSVKKFIPINNLIYVGMNRSFLFDKVKLDFLFAIDLLGIDSFMEEFKNYKGNNCIKFIGKQGEGLGREISESYFLKLKNAKRYITDISLRTDIEIPLEIDLLPLWNSNSIAHQAIQFALWTNPKKIYLIGCDCTGVKSGHFVEGKNDMRMIGGFSDEFWKESNNALIRGWLKIKNFAEVYYPETEIISINPIGLKGIFKDIYVNENKKYVDNQGKVIEI